MKEQNRGEELVIKEEQCYEKTTTAERQGVKLKTLSFGFDPKPTADECKFSGWGTADCAQPLLPRCNSIHSYLASIALSQLFKFAIVGGLGVVLNMAVMVLLIQAGYLRDWRASTIASAVAALHNYLLNNRWTFSDRRRSGRALLNGALLYLSVAALGIALTAWSYSILTHLPFRVSSGVSPFYLLGAQLVSILFGTYLNYRLHKVLTWRGVEKL
jgi:putative flippase GtrA